MRKCMEPEYVVHVVTSVDVYHESGEMSHTYKTQTKIPAVNYADARRIQELMSNCGDGQIDRTCEVLVKMYAYREVVWLPAEHLLTIAKRMQELAQTVTNDMQPKLAAAK